MNRREFLKSILVGITAIVAAPVMRAVKPKPYYTLKFIDKPLSKEEFLFLISDDPVMVQTRKDFIMAAARGVDRQMMGVKNG